VEVAYRNAINGADNPHRRWEFATEKRRRDVDRTRPEWRRRTPELAAFIEAYEAELRRQGLLDFDDMPLLAYRMIKENAWIRDALRARFPVLFIDEYQDLGHALHELCSSALTGKFGFSRSATPTNQSMPLLAPTPIFSKV
jgi:DNA helicase II / ATP-dependent DNA helicase PcrA